MPPLAAALFDYVLPPQLVAQTPTARRDQSRLLVVDRVARTLEHRRFTDLTTYLTSGDTLFRNTATVIPARLHARRPTGGQVECFLLRAVDEGLTWRCLVKPGRKLPIGATFAHPTGLFTGEITLREPGGTVHVRFTTGAGLSIVDIANRLGDVPLPPYITRGENSAPGDEQRQFDLERYQTVYADRARPVAVAAPTAGLHFTPELLAALAAQGVGTADLTLHVGLGTFRPIATDTVEAHPIHRELYEIPASTQEALGSPARGRRIAVGTTTVRAVEDFLSAQGGSLPHQQPWTAEAAIFLYPPCTFRGVDALITNFHQPRSTLLCLVAAFLTPGSTAGVEWLHEIYRDAMAREYRFLSFGDAMLII